MAKAKKPKNTLRGARPNICEFVDEMLNRPDVPVHPEAFRRAVTDVCHFLETAKEVAECGYGPSPPDELIRWTYDELRRRYEQAREGAQSGGGATTANGTGQTHEGEDDAQDARGYPDE